MHKAPSTARATMHRVHTSPSEEMGESSHTNVNFMAVKESSSMSMLSPLTGKGHFQLTCVTYCLQGRWRHCNNRVGFCRTLV